MIELTTEDLAYLDQVSKLLADLPEHERDEHLNELSVHLRAMREDGNEASAVANLGAPSRYVRELRLAAGIKPRQRTWLRPMLTWGLIGTANCIALAAMFVGINLNQDKDSSREADSLSTRNVLALTAPRSCSFTMMYDPERGKPTDEEANKIHYNSLDRIIVNQQGAEIGRMC